MMINDVTAQAGGHRRRKRVGRGESSGMGRTAGRGNKGCQSRSGGGTAPLHEGGATPLYRKLPKRGFSNFGFRVEYEPVNLDVLDERFDAGATVDPAALAAARLVRGPDSMVKILGRGELTKKLSVSAHAFSESARKAIEQAGGSAAQLARRDPAALARAKRRSAAGRATPSGPTRIEKKKQSRAGTNAG